MIERNILTKSRKSDEIAKGLERKKKWTTRAWGIVERCRIAKEREKKKKWITSTRGIVGRNIPTKSKKILAAKVEKSFYENWLKVRRLEKKGIVGESAGSTTKSEEVFTLKSPIRFASILAKKFAIELLRSKNSIIIEGREILDMTKAKK